jgi:hypothetical protein
VLAAAASWSSADRTDRWGTLEMNRPPPIRRLLSVLHVELAFLVLLR